MVGSVGSAPVSSTRVAADFLLLWVPQQEAKTCVWGIITVMMLFVKNFGFHHVSRIRFEAFFVRLTKEDRRRMKGVFYALVGEMLLVFFLDHERLISGRKYCRSTPRIEGRKNFPSCISSSVPWAVFRV